MKNKIIGNHGAQVKPYFTAAHMVGSFSKARSSRATIVVVSYISVALFREVKIFLIPTSLSVH